MWWKGGKDNRTDDRIFEGGKVFLRWKGGKVKW
jgi:hypothetical protein